MSKSKNTNKNTNEENENKTAIEKQQHRRRRLLTSLGLGVLGAYVAPTLFTVGEAQAQRRGSYSRPNYPRRYAGSYSYSYSYPRGRSRNRSRIRDYTEDPLLILEDAIIGSRKR